jgi:hypothetical protein
MKSESQKHEEPKLLKQLTSRFVQFHRAEATVLMRSFVVANYPG